MLIKSDNENLSESKTKTLALRETWAWTYQLIYCLVKKEEKLKNVEVVINFNGGKC